MTTKRFYIFLLTLLTCVNAAWGVEEERNGKTYNVVYLKSGSSGDGDSKDSPVGTWDAAYKKLTNTGNRDYDWEHNIIVIVKDGYMIPDFSEVNTKDKDNKQGTAATITGVWPWDENDNASVLDIKAGGQFRINSTNHTIGSDTRFRNLLIYGGNNSQNRMSLRMHSTLFDTGLIMQNFAQMEESYGATKGRKSPNLHIQLTRDFTKTVGADEYRMPDGKPMEVTFKSGRYGRIAVSRTQGTNPKDYYVQGTPENPIMAHITVDIQDGNDNSGSYADDIAILMGGSSQGFVCADLQFDVKHGMIATLVAGTQGNNISSARNAKIPDASFAGRTKVNVGNENGADDDVTIQTYYGGTQGRAQTTQVDSAPSFFYGESEFNMYSGTIESGVFASATAFSGLGDATNHTPDYAIPYVNASNVLTFGSYSGTGKMATVKSTFHKGEDGYTDSQDYIDLSTTKLTFNIYGGVIKGGLYGGSKGYEPQVSATYAQDGAGTHYGDTYVNVYGGTIKGGVYGGGLGTKEYYNSQAKEGFLKVAQVYGNTHVNIYGGDIQGNIYGGGYGIATDKNEYLPIAKVIGSTNVTIAPTDSEWTFNHNIYGGGAMGAVEGNTNVTIKGGIIDGKVFGAGMGEEGHSEKAKITGNTNVTVGEGETHAQTINGNVYGGGEMSQVDGNTNVTINNGKLGADIFGGGEGTLKNDGTVSMSANISGTTNVAINGGEFAVEYDDSKSQPYPFKEHYNIYGGGNVACQVGETHVHVTKGMVSNASDGTTSFLDNDRFDSGEAGIAQAYYHEGQMYFCVFGGGYGKNTSVTGNTWVDFNIGDGDGIQDISETAIEDDLLEYQSYLDVIGGGFNGAVQGNTNVHVGGNAMCRNVYGGGLYATIGTQGDAETGKTNVHITGGNIDNVYGGGVMGDIMTSTNVNIGLKEASLSFDGRSHDKANNKVTILMSVYGANDVSGHVPQANITHNGGIVDQNIYGAGNGDYVGYYTPNLCAYADGENDNYFIVNHAGDVTNSGPTYKGRPQTENVSITLDGNSAEDKAVVLGQVFGGGNSCTVGHWKTDLSSKYDGDPHQWRNDPEFFEGGGLLNITLGSHVKIGYDNTTLASANEDIKSMYTRDGENVSGLFMGASGSVLATQSDAPDYHHYYDETAKQYKPGFASTDGADAFKAYLNNIMVWSDYVSLSIANDATDIWLANFVGGGFRGSMKRKDATNYSWSLPSGVTIGNCIVGGAYNADVHYIKDATNLQFKGGLLCNDGTTFADVLLTLNNNMDGGEAAGVFGGCYSSGTVKNTQIDYYATGAYDVYGGGALANITGNSVVNLFGGSLTNAYGGGLGSATVAAIVGGDATVTLGKGFGETDENGRYSNYTASKVTGAIFGANNVNGTPKGHVKVHVLSTVSRGQANRNVTGDANNFDVPAVYGGGNKAAYEPTINDNDDKDDNDTEDAFAEVLIENCDNSIGYVYGGGNAAPVPATQVTIYGANAIDNAFAGGNGAGDGNPGADIGYNGYYSKTGAETPKYGTGESHITIYGGTVNNVYGGSNTKGYIRTHAYVDVLEPDGYEGNICELNLGNVSVGGNEAEMFCGGSMTLSCADGAEAIYAGANKADVHGDIDLKITSGTYGKVFGGNNNSGNIYGHIRLDIDEIGCWPVMIGELYGCGNNAPYSVYGYKDNKTCRTQTEFEALTPEQKKAAGFKEGNPYADPIVNIISCTRIDRVFGGGKGEGATVYGSPTVYINTIKGNFAGKTVPPAFILDNAGNRIANTEEISIPDETGPIGTVYGGGDAAQIIGNTRVEIGTSETNKHLNPEAEDEPVSVMILGNVFGGSKGVSGNPAAGRVTGTTKVIIGDEQKDNDNE